MTLAPFYNQISRGIDVKVGTADLYGDRLKNVFVRTDNWTGKCTYNATLRSVCVTVVAVEKQ
jgi:hypothetical protein